MGLGFAVKNDDYEVKAQWSYGGFRDFRKRLASTIGIDLEEMEGFYKKHPTDSSFIKPGRVRWEGIKSPIKYLLNHSDNSGYLNWKKCGLIYPILETILELWEVNHLDDHDNISGVHLVNAIKYCYENKKDLIFC